MATEKGQGDSQSEVKDEELPVVPDGGWGWMVVLGSFVIHVIADGVYYSFGVFLVALLDHFEGAGRGELGWVGSIMIGTLLSVGPIASILTNSFGCRIVTAVGTFMAFTGFIMSIWAPNVYFLYFSFGIVAGTGLGLVYLPAIVSISFYFEKRRSFATGIAVCGSGIGTFVFAPLSQLLLDEYGWKGAVLIEAGLLLNCLVAGLLFRPLEAPRKKRVKTGEKKLLLTVNAEYRADETELGQKSPQILLLKQESGALSSSLHALPTNGSATAVSMATADARLHKSDLHLVNAGNDGKFLHPSPAPKPHPHTPKIIRKDAFYTASLENIPMYKAHPEQYTASMLSIHRDKLDHVTSNEGVSQSEDSEGCLCLSSDSTAELKESMDCGLFKDPLFELFAWSNFLTNFAFFVPYIFIPDMARLQNFSKNKASALVSIIGIANTIGRVGFGFISDLQCVNRLMLYNTAVTAAGIVTIFAAMVPSYIWLACYSCLYGLLIGVYVTLTPIIIVDLLGIEKLSNAFGLVMFFQGVATILGPPIAGWFYDSTGSYIWPFVMFGVMLAISGIMLYPIPCIRRYLEKRRGVTQHDVDLGKQVSNTEYVTVSQTE